MKTVETGVLNIAYEESGPPDGPAAILLHGFPYDIHSYEAVVPLLTGQGMRCLVPYLRGYGPTRFLSSDAIRSGQQGALGMDLLEFMNALEIETAVLAGYDWGGRAACIAAALWPERVQGLVSCGGYNIQDITNSGKPADPQAEFRYWYQYYFHTERGRKGLSQNRRELTRLLWELWSPTWTFETATFARTAEAFDNPDFVEVVIHSYRHRYDAVAGDPSYDDIERRLAVQTTINVPAIVLEGADDGVVPPSAEDADRQHFTGSYRRQIVPGVGHNFPQEAPQVFADAVAELARA